MTLSDNAMELLRGVSVSSTDAILLFDLADRIKARGNDEKALKNLMLERAAALSQKIVNSSSSASIASMAFCRATRGLTTNNKPKVTLKIWGKLPQSKKNFLAKSWENYVRGVCNVIQAYCAEGDLKNARKLTEYVSDDAATPWPLASRCRITLALGYIAHNQAGEAFTIFESCVQQEGKEELLAYSHYWLALREIGRGRFAPAKDHCRSVIQILGTEPKLSWKRALSEIAGLVLQAKSLPELQALSQSEDFSHGLRFQSNLELAGG